MSHPSRSGLNAALADLGVSRETGERLSAFAALLLHWNKRINLLSERDAKAVWTRHILDSLQLSRLVPSAARSAIDLGSGAGFPGLILAIATNLHVDLVESDVRKAAFLREAIRETGASADIHVARIEALSIVPKAIVTARALAPLPRLLELAFPLLRPGGVCLFPKGETVESELTAAAPAWNMRVERFPSRTAARATILRISEISRVGSP